MGRHVIVLTDVPNSMSSAMHYLLPPLGMFLNNCGVDRGVVAAQCRIPLLANAIIKISSQDVDTLRGETNYHMVNPLCEKSACLKIFGLVFFGLWNRAGSRLP